MPFSRRSAHDARPNALTLALSRARAGRAPVLDLTVSNPTRAGIPYDRDAITAALADARAMLYEPEPFGIPSAREAVANAMSEDGLAVAPSRVMLTASTSEAYAFLFKLLCDPGDDLLVPQPSYPLFEHLATFESTRLVPYRVAYDGAWHIDLDSVKRAMGPRTRAILVVSPNNPTGSYLKPGEMRALAELRLPIVADEVFARYPLKGARGPSILASREDVLVFSLGGLSKLAALPQMKLAWTIASGPANEVAEALARLELIADSFLSVGTPVQHALPRLLASRSVAELAIAERAKANLAHLREAIGPSSPLSVLDVEGGWYAIVRLPGTEAEEEWILDFLEHDRVYLHPGHYFDFAGEAYAVVSLLTPEEDLREGIARVVARVAERLG